MRSGLCRVVLISERREMYLVFIVRKKRTDSAADGFGSPILMVEKKMTEFSVLWFLLA